ncbi:glycosyltransferase family 2 protein [uncultured Lacinutrix sp.]|uniref:glycosyltransferase family 2 protein n=1 Tax=uncultured Lacinutrix sp. TaxID=574032 RepID=UPI0026306187|nr:glycosyltransferase family 2 protein [uncultured Lacinutrix sp.]
MQLSVIILNYNVRNFLELCLQSVEAAVKGLDAEIIVIDNNSQDDSCEMVKEKFPNIKLIENKKNLGFSKGNNIGVTQAKGQYLCILNPDTVIPESIFNNLHYLSTIIKDHGIFGCRLIDGRGTYLPESKRNVPTPFIAIKKALGFSKEYYANHLTEKASGYVSVFVGAFMYLKRNKYNEVNGFDEDYFMYGEDIDLSYKIEQSDVKNYYYGNSTIIHYKGESTLKDKVYAKRFYGAMQIFYKKHFSRNIIFDLLVYLGIKSAKFLKSNSLEEKKTIESYVLISNKNYLKLEQQLQKPIEVLLEYKDIKKNTEVILDANYLSFETIINIISTSEKNKNLSFKILPKNANFIIGSNSSKSRGEVVTF